MASVSLKDALRELDLHELPVRRVMIVDDEREILEVLTALLEERWEVFAAESGAEALAMLDAVGGVDVVIADQRMPGMLGVELLSRIAESHPTIVRIVLTGFSDIEPMLDAINSGEVYRFLLKPFDPNEIRAVVADAMELKATSTALALLVQALEGRNESLRETHRELRHAQEQLVRAERLSTLGRITAGVAHDLRNQLTIMSLILQTVQDRTENPELVDSAHKSWAAINALLELLHHINAFARAGQTPIQRQPVSVKTICNDALGLFAMEELGRGKDVRLEMQGAPASVEVDLSATEQALLALLRNAAQAHVGAAAPIHLKVTEPPQGGICFEIHDEGRGVDPGLKDRVMEPFVSGLTPPGLGLGLPIANLVAEAHGGRVELQSTPGRGTVARLWLGRASPHGRS
ncbi:MAG: response regulator [Deltaproteobacteria bacterium]|nr:response regulator [Deltaproteobacteria bacterium]